MKRLALAFALTIGAASTALAADLPIYAPVPAPAYLPAVGYNWTGVYIGGQLGVGWNGGSFSDSIGNTLSLNTQTLLLGGAEVSFNYQFGSGILAGASAAAFLPAPRPTSIGFPTPRAAATLSFYKIPRGSPQAALLRSRPIIAG
jgi:opacity protein-like surface antigen